MGAGIDSVTSTGSVKTYRYNPGAKQLGRRGHSRHASRPLGSGERFYNGSGVLAGGYVAGSATANISNTAISWDRAAIPGRACRTCWENAHGPPGAVLSGSFYVVGGRSIASSAFLGTNDNQKLTCGSTGTPSPTATATATATGTPSPTATATATPTATATATGTPSASPTCAPLTEGFDDITTLPGAGWVQTNHSTTSKGQRIGFREIAMCSRLRGRACTSYLRANTGNTTGTEDDQQLAVDSAGERCRMGLIMTFYTRTVDAPAFPDRLQVRMSTNGASSNVGTTATDVGDFTALLLDINPTTHRLRLPECVDAVHGDGERCGITDQWTAGLPLFCGERRTERSELRFHWDRYVRVRWLRRRELRAQLRRLPPQRLRVGHRRHHRVHR